MTAQNPLDVIAAEPPQISLQRAEEIALERYGLRGRASVLVSERDQNFRLVLDDGRTFVLKIANAAEDRIVTEFQIEALLHIEAKGDTSIRTPRIFRALDGSSHFVLDADGKSHVARVVTYLQGEPLGDRVPDANLCRDMGAYLARLGRSLADFEHPGAEQSLLWDMKEALKLREILPSLEDPAVRDLVAGTLDDFEQHALPVFDSLRWQVIHSDLHSDNLLVEGDGSLRVAGVIDFGDMLRSPLIVDVAVGSSYLRAFEGNPLGKIVEFLAAYHREVPLMRAEIDILHDLIRARLAATVTILGWRLAIRGADDPYLQESATAESRAAIFLGRLSEIPRENAAQIYRQVCASAGPARP